MDLVLSSLTHLYEAVHHAEKRRILTPLEGKLEKAMVKAFAVQKRSFMQGFIKLHDQFPATTTEARRLREVIADTEYTDLFDASDEDSLQAFVLPLEDAVKASLLAAGMQQLGELGMNISFDLKNPRAVAYIQMHGAELVSKIDETTREYIQNILAQATEEGWSYDRVAQTIIDRYDQFSVGVPGEFTSRAQRIAVNEMGNAYEEGNFEPIQDMMDSGIDMEKSWDTAPELSQTGPCEDCQANEAEGWIPADELHQSGDDHPLGHLSCYCDEYYQAKGE